MLCGLLKAQMVMSVTRQVVQVALCVGTIRTGCNRRVFSLGGSASTGEAGLLLVFLPGTKQVVQCTSSQYSPVGMYLSAGRFFYILREAVFPISALFFQFLSFLLLFCFSKSLYLPVSQYQFLNCLCLFQDTNFSYLCSCFTIPNPVLNLSLFNFWLHLHIHVAATI